MRYLIILSIFLVGCNPCKYVSKHPECFQADSVIINKETVRYEKEFITNDSIVFKAIPCDPIDSIIFKTKTIYKTRNIIKIDTIYKNKEVSKLNPINAQLQQSNTKLSNKIDRKNMWLKITTGLSIVLLLILGIILYFKRL
jgi:hypothetical protein